MKVPPTDLPEVVLLEPKISKRDPNAVRFKEAEVFA
jgi:hypothetical protein